MRQEALTAARLSLALQEIAGMRAIIVMHEANNNQHAAEMVRSEARYSDLMIAYRQLRLQGHTAPVAVALPAPEPTIIDQAIMLASRGLPVHIRAGMYEGVEKDRASGKSDVEIAQRIRQGHRPMDDLQ